MKVSSLKKGKKHPAGRASANARQGAGLRKVSFSKTENPESDHQSSCPDTSYPPGEIWFSHPRLSRIRAGETLMGYGASGSCVSFVQQAIAAWGCDEGLDNLLPDFGADGIFGAETLSAVKTFQNGQLIHVDGIVGPVTIGQLDQFIGGGQLICPSGTAPASFVTASSAPVQLSSSCTPPGTIPQGNNCPCGCPLPAPSGANPAVGELCKVQKNATAVDDFNKLFCPADGDPVKIKAKEPANFVKVELLRHKNKEVHINKDFLKNCTKPKIQPETIFPAPDGSGKNRQEVGVGEQVNFKAGIKGVWTATNGSPKTKNNVDTYVWTAPNRADSSVEVKFKLGSFTDSVFMDVKEPNKITADKLSEMNPPKGKVGAGMKLRFNYHPKNVSFGNVESKEVSGPASNIKGYYEQFPKKKLAHDSKDTFFSIRKDNKDSAIDEASEFRSPKPFEFEFGHYAWIIPNNFRVKSETGDGKKFTEVTQFFHMVDDTGRMRVLKAGEEVEKP
jgi:hypothetical protein